MLFAHVFKSGRIKGFRAGDPIVRQWLRDKANALSSRNVKPHRLLNQKNAKETAVEKAPIGKLLFYNYDPKHKDTLPYYDRYPIVFPIEIYKDGFLGINLHYLPPLYRAKLMDALHDTVKNKKYNEKTKLAINYQILKNAAKYEYFKPCVKRYLGSHIRSDMVMIPAEEWEYAIFLPLARFEKQNQRKVWDDSIKMIQGKK